MEFTCKKCGKKFVLEDMHLHPYDDYDRYCNDCWKEFQVELENEKKEERELERREHCNG